MKFWRGLVIVYGAVIWYWIYDKGYVSLYGTKYYEASSDAWMFYFWLFFIPAWVLKAIYDYWLERSFRSKTGKNASKDLEQAKPNQEHDKF